MSGTARGPTARRVVPLLACGSLLLCQPLLVGCAGADQQVAEHTSSSGRSTVSVEYEMSDAPVAWKTGELQAGASLVFSGGVYRMTAGTWPLVSPNLDPRAMGLDPVEISATFDLVSGSGLYGVACAVTASSAYIFVVGVRADGSPYYGIAHLTDGIARVLRDSTSPGSAPARDVLPESGPTRVGASCRASGQAGTALLGLAVDDDQLLEIEASDAAVDAQVGLIAVSRVPGASLVVEVDEVSVHGVPAG